MNATIKQTPNISKGRTIKPEGIILHHTAGSYAGSVNWCMRAEAQVSYHIIVDTNGDYTVLAQDNQRAWHAGRSSFRGKSDCNSFMLGIAVSGDTNARKLTYKEANTVALLCIEKMKLHGFGIYEITTHAKVSPGRKTDISDEAFEDIMFYIREHLNLNC